MARVNSTTKESGNNFNAANGTGALVRAALNDILNAYSTSHTKGLKTEIDSKSILYWSKIILKMAKDGLKKRNFLNKKGNDETVYLKNVEHILINGRTKAEDALKNYK